MDPQSTPQQSTPPQSTQQSHFSLFLGLLALSFFLSTLLLGYQNRQMRIQLKTLQSKIIEQSTTTSPTNEMNNWQTFTNTRYGFSIQYPSDFSLKELEPAGLREYSIELVNALSRTSVRIVVVGNKKSSAAQLAQSFVNGDASWMNNPSIQYSPITQKNMGGYTANTFFSIQESQIGKPEAYRNDYYFIDSKTFNFMLHTQYLTSESSTQKTNADLDQILSTFKFIDN